MKNPIDFGLSNHPLATSGCDPRSSTLLLSRRREASFASPIERRNEILYFRLDGAMRDFNVDGSGTVADFARCYKYWIT